MVAVMAHEHSGSAPKAFDLWGVLRKPHPQASAVEADWLSRSSPPVLMAAAAVRVAVVVVVAVGAVEGEAVACWGSVAAGSENQLTWGVFDGAEALSCVLVTGSLFGLAGSERRS